MVATTEAEAASEDFVIEDAGESDYTLVVTLGGDVEARKPIPSGGVRVHSSADHPRRRDATSEFGLDIAEVVHRYAVRSDSQAPEIELHDDVTAALQELSGIVTEDER
jgi:hypothetical protein